MFSFAKKIWFGGLILGVVVGRMIINEYDVVGEDGVQGHSWTVTQSTDLPSMIMQVSEYHSDGGMASNSNSQMGSFYTPNDLFKKALVEFAWISQQFDMLAEMEEQLMSSCGQFYTMNNMYDRATAMEETTTTTPPPAQDTDSLYKYMSYNRFLPMSVALIEPYQAYDDYMNDYNSYAIFELEDSDNNKVIMTSDGTWEDRFYDTWDDYTYNDYDTLDYEYAIQEEDQAECFMLTLFLALACSVIFLGVLASFSQLSKTIKLVKNKKTREGEDEEKVSLKTSLLTPLKPEPAKGLVVAADHVKNADGGRFVDVVYVPLRGD
eukprot:TRINITY_DN3640_c0_g1_i1.p1 TRINITY_DN3640_c0_g1~~TRINITY_DN3640_c0_g1_i1.p1  ORF type:complete len:340 (-),score=56.78 TRINITY_DN3640_c0_g1_i1:571-1533(-)